MRLAYPAHYACHLTGGMLGEGGEQVGKFKPTAVNHRKYLFLHPFAAKRLRACLRVEWQCVETGEQFGVDCAAAGNQSVAVKLQTTLTAIVVEHIVDRTDVKRLPLSVALIRYVGESSYVQTEIIVGKKQTVANRHKRGSLSAEHYVKTTEIADHRHTRLGCNRCAIAYLKHYALAGLMKDGVSMRRHDVGTYAVFPHKVGDTLAKKLAVFAVERHKVVCRHLLRSRAETVFQIVGIVIAACRIDCETPSAVVF